jgi:hypothetical protein
MKYIYKKIIKYFAVFACTVGLLVSFAGCSGITGNNKKQEEKAQKGCTVSGSVVLEGQNVLSSARSTTTSFALPEGSEYKIRAYLSSSYNETNNTYTYSISSETLGTFSSSTMSYTIDLLQSGHWKIELCIVKSGVNTVISATEVDVDSTFENLTNKNLVIKTDFDTYTNGNEESEEVITSSINLEISRNSSSTDISAVKWVWKDVVDLNDILDLQETPVKISRWFRNLTDDPEDPNYEDYPKTITKNFVNNKVTFTFDDVPTWSYNVSFIIVKSNGDEYYFDDVINVFQNFTTDTWYGDSNHLTRNTSTGKYSFIVSDDLLETLQKKGNYAAITESDTPYVLYSNYEKEAIALVSDNGNGGFQYDESDNGVIGTQVFSAINGDEKIENPISSSTNFCFGDNRLYILETQEGGSNSLGLCMLRKYKKSYSGYAKDGIGINILDKLGEFMTDGSTVSGIGQIAYSNGFICFQWSYFKVGSGTVYNFAVVDASSGQIVNSVFTVESILSSFIVNTNKTSVDIQGEPNTKYEGYLYYFDRENYQSPVQLKVAAITIKSDIESNVQTLDSVTLTGPSNASFVFQGSTLVSNTQFGSLGVGDMILQDNYLYVLIKFYGAIDASTYIKVGEEEYEPRKLYTSTGGILKFRVSSTDGSLTQEDWTINGKQQKLLGLYTKEIKEEDNYYTYNWQTGYSEYTAVCALTPPLNSTQVYFYGPKKFIARKPDALVIADDGGYIEEDSDSEYNLTAKNRVVTVNLTDLSLSAVDVKATFSTTFSATGSDPTI